MVFLTMNSAISLAERGLVPAPLIRWGIRRLCAARLRELSLSDCEAMALEEQALLEELRGSPVALHTEAANEQHYEVPTAFFQQVLGRHLKYSGCYWPEGTRTLDEAEAAALAATCERAELEDGQRVLELGCGWGSLSLWMAEHYPESRITAVSNSAVQRVHIEAEAKRRGLANLEVWTADVNELRPGTTYDRVVSVEMFEHMRNYEQLLGRIASWLEPGGKLFVHIFCHRERSYPFVVGGDGDWMARHFFTGGLMPGDGLLLHFQRDLELVRRWRWDGRHYQRTAEAWRENLERNRAAILPILEETHGAGEARRWFGRWKVFFLACAELFGYERGQQWWVSHYLFEKKGGE